MGHQVGLLTRVVKTRLQSKRELDRVVAGAAEVDQRMFERLREGLAVDDESLAFDTVAEVGPGGLFLAHDHTLARFRTDVFMSPLFRSQAYPTWVKLGSPAADEVATGEWRKLLDSYVDPGIPDEIDAELRDYIDQRAAVLEA